MMPENPKVKNKNGGIHLFGGERWKNNIVPYIIDGNSGIIKKINFQTA